jgi:hypothetical protein
MTCLYRWSHAGQASSRIIRAFSVVTVLQIQISCVLLEQHFIGQKMLDISFCPDSFSGKCIAQQCIFYLFFISRVVKACYYSLSMNIWLFCRCYCILYNTRPFWRTIIFNEDERHHNGDMPFPRPSCLLLGNKIVKTEEGYNYTVS